MQKLTREQMKKVFGGSVPVEGTCCYHTSDWSEQICNVSKAEAQEQAVAQGSGWKWCCASCPTA